MSCYFTTIWKDDDDDDVADRFGPRVEIIESWWGSDLPKMGGRARTFEEFLFKFTSPYVDGK